MPVGSFFSSGTHGTIGWCSSISGWGRTRRCRASADGCSNGWRRWAWPAPMSPTWSSPTFTSTTSDGPASRENRFSPMPPTVATNGTGSTSPRRPRRPGEREVDGGGVTGSRPGGATGRCCLASTRSMRRATRREQPGGAQLGDGALLLGDVVHCPVELIEQRLAGLSDVDPALAQRDSVRRWSASWGRAGPPAAGRPLDGLRSVALRCSAAEGRCRRLAVLRGPNKQALRSITLA